MQGPPEQNENEESAGYFTEINVTPLTDVFLVLLIIFMVVASASVEAERSSSENASSETMPDERALKVHTPQGASDGAIMAKNIVVNVLPDGSIDLGGELVTIETIGAKLTTMDQTHSDQVVIRGDEAAQYRLVVRVLSAVRTAGFNRVALATRSP